MGSDREARRQRLGDRLGALRGRQARPTVIDEVERLTGRRPNLDDFLSADATRDLLRRYVEASRIAEIRRQTWTTDLRAEMSRAVFRLADTLATVEAYWLHRASSEAGAVRVPVPPILRHAADTFVAGAFDVVLVTACACDGVRLAWDDLPSGAEFELVGWGSHRR